MHSITCFFWVYKMKYMVDYDRIIAGIREKYSYNDERVLDRIYKKAGKKLESNNIDIISYIW